MMTTEKSPTPLWKEPLLVWLKSEFLDSENFLRLGGTLPEFDGASWPLGIRLATIVDGNVVDRLAQLNVIDAQFDERALKAWQLPWHYSQLTVHSPRRRDDANFVITNVGNWSKQPGQYDDLASLLASRRIYWGPDVTFKSIYAITPFSLASQYWIENSAWRDDQIVYTDVVLFYTFETYIQETLARTALERGVSPAQIARSYEHVYCSSRPLFDAVPTNLAELPLAGLANPMVDWDELRTTAKNARANSRQGGLPEALPRGRRQTLFELRLDLHLMVAIAAACHGLQGFRELAAESPLVRVSERPPSREDVVAHWLGHMLGTYDHAAACQQLLVRLAQRYDRKLSQVSQAGPDLNGIVVPQFEGRAPVFSMPRTQAEREIVRAGLRNVRDAGRREGFDRYRWGVFEPSLDDESILRWQQERQRSRP